MRGGLTNDVVDLMRHDAGDRATHRVLALTRIHGAEARAQHLRQVSAIDAEKGKHPAVGHGRVAEAERSFRDADWIWRIRLKTRPIEGRDDNLIKHLAGFSFRE